MPLRGHFRPPLKKTHSWDELHGQWPGEIVRHLMTILPQGFRAAPKVHPGSLFEVDVCTYDLNGRDADSPRDVGNGGTATQTALAPTYTVEADIGDQDEYEVRIYDVEHGRELVAAIEIVSPSNRDRPERRDQFLGKVETLLNQDVCVTLVDLVSIRLANLYAELLTRHGCVDPQLAPKPPPMYAVTVRARPARNGRSRLDAWFYPMAVGQPLPTLPIWLTSDLSVMVPFETSYEETCRILGIE